MSESYELSRVSPGSLTTAQHTFPFYDEVDPLIQYFRAIFAAERCIDRTVYWFERRTRWSKSRIIIRRVLSLRDRKKDHTVAVLRDDFPITLIPLVIASIHKGEILTGTRWELYEDRDLTTRIRSGRFDHIDLLQGMQLHEVARVAADGTVGFSTTLAHWDFDGLFATHQCPTCQKFCDVGLLIFSPQNLECNHCPKGHRPDASQYMGVVKQLVRRITDTHAVGHLSIPEEEKRVGPGIYLDPLAGPLFCWIVDILLKGSHLRLDGAFRNSGITTAQLLVLYRRSKLFLIEHWQLAEEFADVIETMIEETEEELQRTAVKKPPAFMNITHEEHTLIRDAWSAEARERYDQNFSTLHHLGRWVFELQGEEIQSLNERAMQGGETIPERRIIEAVQWYPHLMSDLLKWFGKSLITPNERSAS